MNNCQLVNQDSGIVEYYTPRYIVDAARRVLGGIDLDPASSPVANQTVKAGAIFTIADDGLTRPWFGRVWLNHPYSKADNKRWPAKLIGEYLAGRVEAACMIVFAATSEKWFQPLYDFPICFLYPRVKFQDQHGRTIDKGPTKGSVVVYLGRDLAAFGDHFGGLGRVMTPAGSSVNVYSCVLT